MCKGKSRRAWSVICACLMITLMAPLGLANNDDAEEGYRIDASGQWLYDLEGGSSKIIMFVGKEPVDALSIPRELGGYPVTSIDDYAISFFDNDTTAHYTATRLTIPDTVISIGDYAFIGCESITNITIPDSVTSIGIAPFPMHLPHIHVSPDNPAYEDRDGVLFDKRNNALVSYPGAREGAYAIPEDTLSIGYAAFEECSEAEQYAKRLGIAHVFRD